MLEELGKKLETLKQQPKPAVTTAKIHPIENTTGKNILFSSDNAIMEESGKGKDKVKIVKGPKPNP